MAANCKRTSLISIMLRILIGILTQHPTFHDLWDPCLTSATTGRTLAVTLGLLGDLDGLGMTWHGANIILSLRMVKNSEALVQRRHGMPAPGSVLKLEFGT